jgi:bla regulator protein BlaR1
MSPLPIGAHELLALAGDHLWQSTIFAAVAALVAVALRRQSPSLRYWVWFSASAKFLVPFAALVALGGYSSWRSIEVVPYRDGPILLETVGQPFSRDTVTVNPAGPGRSTSPVSANVPTVLLWVWALGAVVFLTRSLVQWRRIGQIARLGTRPADGRELRILRALEASGLGWRRPLPLVLSNSSLEPGVFGIVRPVLLWPRAIGERLTDEQLEAILAHELCHLRRGDNLAALFHLGVQTLFWFHPLAWWIGARLITERERACDEAVLRHGSEREIYAESILKTCQFFVESPLPCVSGVTGSDLKKRIEEIMTSDSTFTMSPWRKALLAIAGAAVFVTPVAVGALNPPAQTRPMPAAATLPAFEEVSVRPNVSEGRGGRGGGAFQPGRYVAQNVTLKTILRRAFGRDGSGPGTGLDLFEDQVVGGPTWLNEDKFDIIGTTTAPSQPAQMRLMVQRMLAERFKLAARWETRELPVYVLTMDRPDRRLGPGLTLKSEADCAAVKRDGPPPMPQPGVPAPPPPCGAIQFGPGQLIATGAPMEWLANTLTSVPVVTGIERMVLDRTSLKGNYGFTLKFAAAGSTSPDPERPELTTALREQLGIKLEATRAPVDVLVIDSVEKPTAN